MAQRIEVIGSVICLAGHLFRLRHLVLLVMWPSLGRDHSRGSTQLPRRRGGALKRRRSAVVSLASTAPASTVPARFAIFVSRALSRVVALVRNSSAASEAPHRLSRPRARARSRAASESA